MSKVLSIKEKSVKINIESEFFGTIAEIGGGQETARNLFQAGGASKTVAKTISAYDKKFSDFFYNSGKPSRYVASDRLTKMLKFEYEELQHVLKDDVERQRYFAFANTVETLNFHKTNEGHGWLGVMFEGKDGSSNEILVHVKLKEHDALLQQYTLGALGINLVYASMFLTDNYKVMLQSLLDNLDLERVEIDYVHLTGNELENPDNRLLNLFLVARGMTHAIMFDKDGSVQQPSDMLYKKNVFVIRGHFRPLNNLGLDIINHSLDIFKQDEEYEEGNTISFCEISLRNLKKGTETRFDETDFLNRVDLLNAMGQCVMISNFRRYFRLVEYFDQFKLLKLRFVMGTPTFMKVMDEEFYTDLRGGLLEAMGRLFIQNIKLYIYPSVGRTQEKVVFPRDMDLPENVVHLLKYLENKDKILRLESANSEYHCITNRMVDELIECGSPELGDYIPQKILEIILDKGLFGYPS